ncbi:hypothetical protein ABTQ33_05090 [Paucilactobacillus suebicus]|uniref:Uncharacterized protein n=1 Tax=Paucilactobacillus suebicus DSM 5007 = KCTC 3549 TaxID=1423807 RepID=A0A0R1W3G1_9LACO|nr:hypothetical protein [Paucilactobacillus suebicus]KRM12318.1 hypothetical protein FD16_GL002503 [Paucilactobacillus suebicus DSM 5007 = KCTC 3549]
MLLDEDAKILNIINAQIVKVFYPFVIAQSEYGEMIKVNLSSNEFNDSLFWDSIYRVFKAKLWVPIGKKYHQLLDNDWLLPEMA